MFICSLKLKEKVIVWSIAEATIVRYCIAWIFFLSFLYLLFLKFFLNLKTWQFLPEFAWKKRQIKAFVKLLSKFYRRQSELYYCNNSDFTLTVKRPFLVRLLLCLFHLTSKAELVWVSFFGFRFSLFVFFFFVLFFVFFLCCFLSFFAFLFSIFVLSPKILF